MQRAYFVNFGSKVVLPNVINLDEHMKLKQMIDYNLQPRKEIWGIGKWHYTKICILIKKEKKSVFLTNVWSGEPKFVLG